MARVPYTGVPEASPALHPAPSISVATPIAAFGGASAAAEGELGKQLERSGDELFQRAVAMQQLSNATEASEANVKFMSEAGEVHAK